jgi:adenylosuccinate synthase
VGICKAYTTRVGSGPFPTELDDADGEALRDRGKEYGSTTGRPRRCGWFDAVVVREAVRTNGVTGLALMKLDVLTGMDTLRICTGYKTKDGVVDYVPSSLRALDSVEPVYEDMPGWKEDLTGVGRLEDLPKAALDYVRRLEELVGAPALMVSVGPGREETISLKNPFDAAA